MVIELQYIFPHIVLTRREGLYSESGVIERGGAKRREDLRL